MCLGLPIRLNGDAILNLYNLILNLILLSVLAACNGGGGGASEAGGAAGNGSVGDPLYQYSWHLKNDGQNTFSLFYGAPGVDINVTDIHAQGITGRGIEICVSDTRIDLHHEDINGNKLLSKSRNYLLANPPYIGNPTATVDEHHGTSVAGIIGAVANNNLGSRGVAYKSKIAGMNFLLSQSLYKSIDQASVDVDIFNYSYGATECLISPLDPAYENALMNGALNLRGGKGAIYIQAAGNEHIDSLYDREKPNKCLGIPGLEGINYYGNSNMDQSRATPFTIIVGAINSLGFSSSYSTPGSNLWISAPGGEYGLDSGPSIFASPAIIAPDIEGCDVGSATSLASKNEFERNGNGLNPHCNYTSTMNGTSSAAPVLSGVVALMLEANPSLKWRDVKHILAKTARIFDYSTADQTHPDGSDLAGHVYDYGWKTNYKGYKFHNSYGFGVVDAKAAVEMAKAYNLDLGLMYVLDYSSPVLNSSIPNNSSLGTTSSVVVNDANLEVESIQLELEFDHPVLSDLGVELISPSGTKNKLMWINSNILEGSFFRAGTTKLKLLSNAFYMEDSLGTWQIKVVDGGSDNSGKLISWKMSVYGHQPINSDGATPPVLSDIPDQVTNEDQSIINIPFTITDAENSLNCLNSLSGWSSNSSVISLANITVGGTAPDCHLSITPQANASGSATINITVSDGYLTANDSFLVTVNAVGDAPYISDVPNKSINEDSNSGAIAFTILDVDSALTCSSSVSASSSNTAVVPLSNITISGTAPNCTVLMTPVANSFGPSNVTLTVSDGSLVSSDNFTLTVNPVNDAPTISDITNKSTSEDTTISGVPLTINDPDSTLNCATSISKTSSNSSVLSVTGITISGTAPNCFVSISPVLNASGVSTVSFTVSDGSLSMLDTFTVTVISVNDAPIISDITNKSTNEDTVLGPITFTILDVDSTLNCSTSITKTSSISSTIANSGIVVGGTGSNCTMTITPVANANGTAMITLTVSDGSLTTSDSFDVVVNAVNDAPAISLIATTISPRDITTGSINFSVSDVDSTLNCASSVSKATSNSSVLNVSGIVISGTAPNCSMTLTPVASISGSVTVTMTVSDGSLTANSSFSFIVNDLPLISTVSDQRTQVNIPTAIIPISISDTETALSCSSSITKSSSNTSIVAVSGIAITGTAPNCNLIVTAVTNAIGSSTISLTVSDGTSNRIITFGVTTYNPWNSISTVNAPSVRSGHQATWTGSQMIIWGDGTTNVNSGAMYNQPTDTWTTITSNGWKLTNFSTVWDGTYMYVIGGYNNASYTVNQYVNRFNPVTNTWSTFSNLPAGRRYQSAIIVGSKIFVWGGTASDVNCGSTNSCVYLNTGYIYDLNSPGWTSVSTTNAPSGRISPLLTSVGSKVIVWGGMGTNGNAEAGGVYDLPTNTWTAISTSNQHDGYIDTNMISSGSQAFIWSGSQWGGLGYNGKTYNPSTNLWTAVSTTNAPSPISRNYVSTVWTGTEAIVWGGNYSGPQNSGARYNPVNNTWTQTTTYGAPAARSRHSAVWTGTQMIIWGGNLNGLDTNTGATYTP